MPPDVLMCCLYFSAATGTPGPPPQATGSTPQSTESSVVVQADVHRVNVEEEDEDYDEVLEMEQGNDGEDLEAVAADRHRSSDMFQPIHFNVSLHFSCCSPSTSVGRKSRRAACRSTRCRT